jgi:hypothetical protein
MRTLIASSALVAAALLAATPGALAQTGNPQPEARRFCLQDADGVADCRFDTLAQCHAARSARGGAGLACFAAPDATVGSGSGDREPRTPPR